MFGRMYFAEGRQIMAVKAKLPMGIEDFNEMRKQGFYYIDKTGLIKELLEHFGKINLFTRPRRFGKTLNMSMLKYFFEIGTDSSIFEGLEISKEKELCAQYMGKYPVISITLKGATGENFVEAREMLRRIIGNAAMHFQFLLQSEQLTEIERNRYKALINIDNTGIYTMSDELLKDSLLILSQLLQKHYNQNIVILIDEYDVPLDKAYQSGYYDAMVELIRALFGNAFKTNNCLYLAFLTGCLRISKESIFTGLNNFSVYTIKDVQYKEYFGFTDNEVQALLAYYDFMDKYTMIKEWYNGYHFGDLDIYCPWDVVSYCHALRMDSSIRPQNYWVNTSSNNIIRKFIDKADSTTKGARQTEDYTELVIPNKEIQWIFEEQIQEWFETETQKDRKALEDFYRAFEENNTDAIEKGFTSYLRKTISIRDTNTKKEMKENFYHGILLGLFAGINHWKVKSNAAFDEACKKALQQIQNRNYEDALLDEGMTTIRKYGIACYKKRCKVISG